MDHWRPLAAPGGRAHVHLAMHRAALYILCTLVLALAGPATRAEAQGMSTDTPAHTIVLGGGCFWCLESALAPLPGVLDTQVGYAGGHVEAPRYAQVTNGRTGHAEAVRVAYDPAVLPLDALLDAFLTKAHDPTQKDRQGVDVGPQYRSVLLVDGPGQEAAARAAIARAAGAWSRPVVTTVEPLGTFWPAEGYHQDYYAKWEAAHGRPHPRVVAKQRR